MKEKKKKAAEETTEAAESETYLKYVIKKLIFIVKDGGRVHIDNINSGKPPDPPPYIP